MKYTVRFAHLAEKPTLKIGDTIKCGDVIGKMGSTGQSTAAHLHIDCVQGFQKQLYTLYDIENEKPKSAPKQLNYFIDNTLFKKSIVITTPYCDAEYQRSLRKVHHGYDVVPQNRKEQNASLLIYWNRSKQGEVLHIYDDPAGYGHCVCIGFEA